MRVFFVVFTFLALSIQNLFAVGGFSLTNFPLTKPSEEVNAWIAQKNLSDSIEIIWSFEEDQWKYWASSQRSDITTFLSSYQKISYLQMGKGYVVGYKKEKPVLDFSDPAIITNSVTLPTVAYSLASFNLSSPMAISALFDKNNLSTGNASDLKEVWFYDSTLKIWKFWTPNAQDSRFNTYQKLETLNPGDALWLLPKVENLTIRLNNLAPIFVVSGTSSMVPPSISAPSPSRFQSVTSASSVVVPEGTCKYDGADTTTIGTAYLFTINGDQISSSAIYCPANPQTKISYNLAVPASFALELQEKPALNENLVVRISLFSGQEEKAIITQSVSSLMNSTGSTLTINTDAQSSFITVMAEMEIAKKSGINPQEITLGVAGNSVSGKTIELTQFFENDEDPVDLVGFQNLVKKMLPSDVYGTAPQNHLQQIIQTVANLNDPAIDPAIRQSVKELFTTTATDTTAKQLQLISKTFDYINAASEADKNGILAASDENPVTLCSEKMLDVDEELLSKNGTTGLLQACDLVEENVKLASAVMGDPLAKAKALENIENLKKEFSSSALTRISTNYSPFDFLNLTAKLISFPESLLIAMGENQKASEALSAMMGKSAELLAQAKALDNQASMVNATNKEEILKAIAALEAENEKLSEKVFTIAKDPEEIVKRVADYIANGGDPSQINEISEILQDKFGDGQLIDYAALIDGARAKTYNPTTIITDLIKASSDPLIAMKVFAESANLLTKEQLESVLFDKEIKENYSLDRNIIAIAGKDKLVRTGSKTYTLNLDGSASFDPKGDTNLLYTWEAVSKPGGNVIKSIQNNNVSAKASVTLTDIPSVHFYRLTVSNADGSRSAVDEVRYEFYQDPLPVIILSHEFQSVQPGAKTTFSASSSFYPDGGEIDSWEITQTEGPSVAFTFTDLLFGFTPSQAGEYHFQLKATKTLDHTSVSSVTTAVVRVLEQIPPLVDAGLSTQIQINDSHTLSNFTFSPTGASLTYKWTPSTYLSSSSAKEPVFTPLVAGIYEFTLDVEDQFGGSASDTVKIEVLEKYKPVALTEESITLNFKEIAEDSVDVILNGCQSYSLDGNPLTYSWSSTTYTSSISNSLACSTFVSFHKNDYKLKSTHHFVLEVKDGNAQNKATYSVHILPAQTAPPQIILEFFPKKEVYLVGEELDIEGWKSFSYNDLDLIYSWVGMDPDSRAISNSYRSKFNGLQRDSLEISIPTVLDTTSTSQKIYTYRFSVTEKRADNTLGLSSFEIVKIKAGQVCQTAPLISFAAASQTWYRVKAGVQNLNITADYSSRCFFSDGSAHPVTASWSYDTAVFKPSSKSTPKSMALSLDLEEYTSAPTASPFILTVTDLANNKTAVTSFIIDLLPEVDCKLSLGFPGKEKDANGYYQILPETEVTVAGELSCSDPKLTYTSAVSNVYLDRFLQSSPTAKTAIYSFDKKSTDPSFSFITTTVFDNAGIYGFTVRVDGLEKEFEPVYANVQYLEIVNSAKILERRDHSGSLKQINDIQWEEYTTSPKLVFTFTASDSKNPNLNGQLNYFWEEITGASTLSFSATDTMVVTALIENLDAFSDNIYTIRLTLSDPSKKATTVTTELSLIIHQDNELPAIVNLNLEGSNFYNHVSLTYDLSDFENESSKVSLYYSTDGENWKLSNYSTSKTDNLSSVAPGIYKGIVWNSQNDLNPGWYENVSIKLVPTDAYGRDGVEDYTKTFSLSVPQVPVVSAVIEDRICREQGGNSIEIVEASSYKGGCVTETIDFHLRATNEPHPYEDTFRYRWSSNSSTDYWFIPQTEVSGQEWSFGSEEENGRLGSGGVSYNNKLYFWGGTNLTKSEVYNTIHVYDPKKNFWSSATSGGTARRDHNAVLYSGKIYFYGGRYQAYEGELDPILDLSQNIDVYSIASDSWSKITTTINVGFLDKLGVVYKDKLYHFSAWTPVVRGMLGKDQYLNQLYVFDFKTNVWQNVQVANAPTYDELQPYSANLVGGKIYYAGVQSSDYLRKIHILDLETLSFSKSSSANLKPFVPSFSSFSISSLEKRKDLPQDGGSLLWKFDAGSTIGIAPSMNSTESRIYVGGDNFYVLDRDGKEKCRFGGATNEHFNSAAVHTDGTIYVSQHDKKLYALKPDCTAKWSKPFSYNNQAKRPAISKNGILYSPAHNYMFAINGENGEVVWKYQTGGTASRAAVDHDGTIYFGSADKKVYALYPNGKPKWVSTLNAKDYVPRVPSIGLDNTLYVNGKTLFALDTRNGKVKWSYKTDSIYTPFIGEKVIYVTSQKQGLIALHKDGSLKWTFKGKFQDNPVIGDNEIIYVGNQDKYFYAIDADGKEVWKYKADHSVSAFPKLAADGVVFFTAKDTLYALKSSSKHQSKSAWPTFQGDNQNTGRFYKQEEDVAITPPAPPTPPRTGEIVWTKKFCNSYMIGSQPAIDPDGNIWFTCKDDKKVISITPAGEKLVEKDFSSYGQFASLSEVSISLEGNIHLIIANACNENKYTACDKAWVFSLDKSGKENWKEPLKTYSSHIVPVDDDGTIYLNTVVLTQSNSRPDSTGSSKSVQEGVLLAIDKNGRKKWDVSHEGGLFAPVVGPDGSIFFFIWNQRKHVSAVACVSKYGKLEWSYNLDAKPATEIQLGIASRVYLNTLDHQYSFNRDGTLRFKKKFSDMPIDTSMFGNILSDKTGNVYQALNNGILNLSPEIVKMDANGETIWRKTIGKEGGTYVSSQFLGNSNKLYLATLQNDNMGEVKSLKGRFLCFDMNTASELWSATVTNSGILGSTAAIHKSGIAFVPDIDGTMYAIQTETTTLHDGPWSRPRKGNRNQGSISDTQWAWNPNIPNPYEPPTPPDDDDDNGSQPSDPGTSDPVDPTDPGDGGVIPTDPEKPYDPTNPTDPGEPNEPEEGEEDNTKPVQPQPTEPPDGAFPGFRSGYATAVVGNQIYFYGGTVGYENGYQTSYSNTVDIYDIATNQWVWGVPAPVGRSHHTGLEWNGNLYFWGGTAGDETEGTLEIYSPEVIREKMLYRVVNTYEKLTHQVTYTATMGVNIEQLSLNRKNHASVIWKDKLFILGGEDTQGVTNQVAVFDLSKNEIKVSAYKMPSLYLARSLHQAVIWNDKLLVFGGKNTKGEAVSQIEVYDLLGSEAVLHTNFEFPALAARYAHAMSVEKNTLVISGGFIDGTISNLVEILSLNEQGASVLSGSPLHLQNKRAWHSSLVFKSKVLFIGGKNEEIDTSIEALDLTSTPVLIAKSSFPSLKTSVWNSAASIYEGKILISGGQSSLTTFTDQMEVLETDPSGKNLLRHHPSYGVARISPKRSGHSVNVYEDLMIVSGGFGNTWPSGLLEIIKLTGNNAQAALGSSDGSAQVTFTLKRLKPSAIFSNLTVSDRDMGASTVTGDALITFDLADPTGQKASVSLEYSKDQGATWFEATPLQGISAELSQMLTGTNLQLAWDTYKDFPGNYKDFVVRLRAEDGAISQKSALFDILNSPNYVKALPVVSNVIRVKGDRDDITFSYNLFDGNNENSSLEVMYFDGSKLETIEILSDIAPGTNKTFIWNSRNFVNTYLPGTYLYILPVDGVVYEEGTPGQSAAFDLMNGELSMENISASATCNSQVVTEVDGAYTCGSKTNPAVFTITLDASGVTNENLNEGITYSWKLAGEVAGATIQNVNQAVATLQISDDAILTNLNLLREIGVVFSASQGNVADTTESEEISFNLKKPKINADGKIISATCSGSTSSFIVSTTFYTGGCIQPDTTPTFSMVFDLSASENPNFGGFVYDVLVSGISATITTLANSQFRADFPILPASETQVTIRATVKDLPNQVTEDDVEFTLNLQKYDHNAPEILSLSTEVNEETGIVHVIAKVSDPDNESVIPDLSGLFKVGSVVFSPSASSITNLQVSYQTPGTIEFDWNSSKDVSSCTTGVSVGLKITDTEGYSDTANSSDFNLWNCKKMGTISGIVAVLPQEITATQKDSGTEIHRCVYDSSNQLLSLNQSLGSVYFESEDGTIISTGSVYCNPIKGQYPYYEVPLVTTLDTKLEEDPKLLDATLIKALLNSGQFLAELDTQDRSSLIKNVTPVSLANWTINLTQESSYFFFYVKTLSKESFSTPGFLELSQSGGLIDLPTLRTSFEKAFTTSDPYFIGNNGFIKRTLNMMTHTGRNLPSPEGPMNQVFDEFFTAKKPLDFSVDEQTKLLASFETLREMILERKNLSSDSDLGYVLDAMIQKLFKIGNPGSDGVEQDSKSEDPNNICAPENFSLTIAKILENTMGIASASMGTAFEFAGQQKLDTIVSELKSPTVTNPQNCAEAEATLTRLLQESITLSDEFIKALAKNTQGALDLAELLGESNAVLESQNAQRASQLSTELADIAALDNYLKKLEAANEKLKTLAKNALDSDLLNKLLAESVKASAKATGGTVALIGLIRELEGEMEGSLKIDFNEVIGLVTDSNEIHRTEFIIDVINQAENHSYANEIFTEVSKDLGRDEIQYIIDSKFSDSHLIYVTLSENEKIRMNSDDYRVDLDASNYYDPQDKEKDDAYEFVWTIYHENPSVKEYSFKTSQATTSIFFYKTEDLVQTSPLFVSLEQETGSLRTIKVVVRNLITGNESKPYTKEVLFYDVLPPVAHAGYFEEIYLGEGLLTLDASRSYSPDTELNKYLGYNWTLASYPPRQGFTPSSLKPSDYSSAVTTFSPTHEGEWVFSVSVSFTATAQNITLSDTATVKKYVRKLPPLAADAGLNALIPTTTNYKLLNNTYAPALSSPLIYTWSPATHLDDPSLREPIFSSDQEGEFELTLKVTDKFNQIASDKVKITVQNKKSPFASAGDHREIVLGKSLISIELDASSSFSYVNEPLSYEWSGINYMDLSSLSIQDSTSKVARFIIDPAKFTREGNLRFTLKVRDSIGESTANVSVRLLQPIFAPVLIVEKDPILTYYRSTDKLVLDASKSYSRSGSFLSFGFEQISGPDTQIYLAPTGAHADTMDSAEITLPEFEEDLVEFAFQVSAYDMSRSTAYLEVTTVTQIIKIQAVPLLRKPLIRDVPDRIEVRLEMKELTQTLYEIDASNCRTLDHDGNDLRNPMSFAWAWPNGIVSVENSSQSSEVFQFRLNPNAPELQNIEDYFEATVDLNVKDENTGKIEIKKVILWIYPPFNSIKMTLTYLDEYQVNGFTYPFFDSVSNQWIYKSQTPTDILSFTAGWDNKSNENHPHLTNAHIYGPVHVSVQKDSAATSILIDIVSNSASSLQTTIARSGDYSLSGNGIYNLFMGGGLENGLYFTKSILLRSFDNWVELTMNPQITGYKLDSATAVNLTTPADGSKWNLMGDKLILYVSSNGINQNGGSLNYTYDVDSSSYPVTLKDLGEGKFEVTTTQLPEEWKTAIINITITDSLGRPDINPIATQIHLDLRKGHSRPQIIIKDGVKQVGSDFVELRYQLIDPDNDLNDVEFYFTHDGTHNDAWVAPVHVEGELSVRHGDNYLVRWYFPKDGAYFVNNIVPVDIKLVADDHSYHQERASNTAKLDIKLENGSADTHNGVLRVDTISIPRGLIALENEPNNLVRDTEPLVRAKAGDRIILKGGCDYPSDIRDSFQIEVVGAVEVSLSLISENVGIEPDLAVFDRRSQKFVKFIHHPYQSTRFLLNEFGGIHRYDIVLMNLPEEIKAYEILADFERANFDQTVFINEVEPNNFEMDAQDLGMLHRAISYEIEGKISGNDFYAFEVFDTYPLNLRLHRISGLEGEVTLTLWNRKDKKAISQYKGLKGIDIHEDLEAGSWLIQIEGPNSLGYLLRLFGSEMPNYTPMLADKNLRLELQNPLRKLPLGVNYFEGLYKGSFSPVIPGSLVRINPDAFDPQTQTQKSVSKVSASVMQTQKLMFEEIKITLPSQIRKSMLRVQPESVGENTLAQKYEDIFATIEASQTYSEIYGSDVIEPNFYFYSMATTPNDPYYTSKKMWHLDAIHLPEAWDITKGSKEIIVGVIDTGMPTHPDLSSGFNDPSGVTIQGYDFVNKDNDHYITSGNEHGLHVAGTIGAKTNNALGIAGVNWEVSIMPLRVCPDRSCDGNAIYNAILYSAGLPNSSGKVPSKRADVINMSLGGPGQSSGYQQAMAQALAKGTLPVCAAGNDGISIDATFYSPVGYDECVGVSAIDESLTRAYFSNYGKNTVDIGAPGTNIWSTIHGNTYAGWQGTSMATPHVAGVAALVKSVNPQMTPIELRAWLMEYSTDLGPTGKDDTFGNGFLNAFASVSAAAEDSGFLAPKLSVIPQELIYLKDVSYLPLNILTKGKDPVSGLNLNISYTDNPGYSWIHLRKQDGFGTTPSRVGVYVDKYSLQRSGGSLYRAVISVSASDVDAVTVPVEVHLYPGETTRPLIFVQNIVNNQVTFQTVTGFDEGYFYSLPKGTQPGYLFAGTDLDHDGSICDEGEKWCGAKGGLNSPATFDPNSGLIPSFEVTYFNLGYYPSPKVSTVQAGEITSNIPLTFNALSSSPASIEAFYRTTITADWTQLSEEEFSTSGLQEVTYVANASSIWKSELTLPGYRGDVYFMLLTTAIDQSASSSSVTKLFVNNNHFPTISNLSFSSNRRDISFTGSVSDSDHRTSHPELLSVKLQYKRPGLDWRDAGSVSGSISGIEPTTFKAIWHSHYDFKTNEPGLELRVSVSDGKDSVWSASVAHSVLNSSPAQSEWNLSPINGNSFTNPCYDFASAKVGNYAYFFCGLSNENIVSNVVHILDLKTMEIQGDKTMPSARFAHTALAFKDKIYLYGGCKSNTANAAALNELLVFDPKNSTFTELSSGPNPKMHHSMAIANEKIYIWGGTNKNNINYATDASTTMDIYDLNSNQWLFSIPLNSGFQAKLGATASVYGSKIYFIGYEIVGGTNSDVIVFDTENHSWSKADFGIQVYKHQAITIDGLFYLWGGKTTSGMNNKMFIVDPSAGVNALSEDYTAGVPSLEQFGMVEFDGKMLIWGGKTSSAMISTQTLIYQPAATQKTLCSFAVSETRLIEGNFDMDVEVSLNLPAIEGQSVQYQISSASSASNADDYILDAGTLTFESGNTSISFKVKLLDDTIDETEETIVIRLVNPQGISLGEVTTTLISVIDDD